MVIKRNFLCVNRKAPYGTIYALEALEVALIGTAFEQNISLLFVDDGVFQLKNNQDTSLSYMKNFSKTYQVLVDYGIDKIYVSKNSLRDRGLKKSDLLDLTFVDEANNKNKLINFSSDEEISKIISQQDFVLSF